MSTAIDRASIAVMRSGARIRVYPGEGASDECFAGELQDPSERDVRRNAHVSCFWDRSQVVWLTFDE